MGYTRSMSREDIDLKELAQIAGYPNIEDYLGERKLTPALVDELAEAARDRIDVLAESATGRPPLAS